MLNWNRWRALSLVVVVAAILAGSACSSSSDGSEEPDPPEQASSVPAATLTGPVTGGEKGTFFGAALADLDSFGYVEEEFYVEGDARTYGPAPGTTLGADGRWSVVETGSVPYKSRMIVRRPTDPAKFNGTVVVVWLNATAGFEIGDFGDAQLLERGYAQVFVSAQRDGLEGEAINGPSVLPGLKEWDPTRYGSLSIPSNDASFDVYSQAAASVGPERSIGEVDPMPGMDVQRLVAYGGSQSAAWLLTYYNAVQPTAQVFDGFMPIQHFGTGRPLAAGVEMPTTLRFRDDSPTPVLLVNGEGEAAAYAPSIQPDTDTFRLWEY